MNYTCCGVKNLIDNAVRYTKSGGIIVSITTNPKTVLLSITDTGYGLTEEDKKNLFTEGGKGKESQKVNVDSTGYGLFIAKSIAIAHGGKIWAESKGRGEGSTFFVELPFDVTQGKPVVSVVEAKKEITNTPTPNPSTATNQVPIPPPTG